MAAQNISNSTEENYVFIAEPTSVRMSRLIVFSAILLASLLGNTLVVKTVLSLPRRGIPTTYYLVLTLALAELLNTICLPFLQAYDEMSSWVFGQFLCQLISPLQILANTVVTTALAAIAVCRCCWIVFPGKANLYNSCRCIVLSILFLWVSALALAFPNFLFNTVVVGAITERKTHYWCVTLLPGDTLATFPSHSYKILMLVQIVINFILTSSIMIISYGIVIYKMRFQGVVFVYQSREEEQGDPTVEDLLEMQKTGAQHVDQAAASSRSDSPLQEQSQPAVVPIGYLDGDIFKMFYAVIIIFIACYFPYQVFVILEYFGFISWQWGHFSIVRKFVFVLTCFPSALHPLCYGLMTKFYSKAFSKLILCK